MCVVCVIHLPASFLPLPLLFPRYLELIRGGYVFPTLKTSTDALEDEEFAALPASPAVKAVQAVKEAKTKVVSTSASPSTTTAPPVTSATTAGVTTPTAATTAIAASNSNDDAVAGINLPPVHVATTTTTTVPAKPASPAGGAASVGGGDAAGEGLPVNGLVFWSSDYHITPPGDVAEILKEFGSRMIDKSLSGHCHLRGTCATDLRVINRGNAGAGGPCPNTLRRELYVEWKCGKSPQGASSSYSPALPLKYVNMYPLFLPPSLTPSLLHLLYRPSLSPAAALCPRYNAYKNDPQMRSVDAFLCSYAFAMCELFMSFGRPIVMLSAVRYEVWREPSYRSHNDGSGSRAGRWRELNVNIERIASKPYNTIAANNVYDQEYIKYFTPVKAKLLPSLCGEVAKQAQYTTPSKVRYRVCGYALCECVRLC